MSTPLVECVPNFSEGRRSEVIDAIAAAAASVMGVRLLHRTQDHDHNRSVLTLAGPPAAISEAAFRAIATAAEHIDLRQHSGQHPRMGATDVVPFVPIRNITLRECAQLAHELGARVGLELGLPVYCYEAAATRPERHNLADVRRGGYEALAGRMANDPPDYGPAVAGPAGAVIMGAREVLIAFNVFLNTDDVSIARQIAGRIRQSSGGLPAVKALGLLVDGQAQVSMNLTDYHQTAPHDVVVAIEHEAAQYGVTVDRSELIGLMPQAAVIAAARHALRLPGLDAGQIIESQMQDL